MYLGIRNKIDECPDIHATMKASNINFQAKPSLKSLLLNSLERLTAEIYTNKQGISESMFDELGSPIDQDDVQGNDWPLPSKSVVFGRPKLIISEGDLQRRTDLMVKDLEPNRVTRVQKLQNTQIVFELNTLCTEKLFKVASLIITSSPR